MYLLFSDIHANRQAAKDIETIAYQFDTIICAGDICGYDLDFEYVIDMLVDLDVKAIRGNHDDMVLNPFYDFGDLPAGVVDPILATRKSLKGRYRDYLESLPTALDVGQNVFVSHTPKNENYCYSHDDCKPLLWRTARDIMVIGHTHTQDVFRFGNRQVINPGSITKGRRGHSRGYAVLDGENVRFEQLEKIK